jgi:hypothetical protein
MFKLDDLLFPKEFLSVSDKITIFKILSKNDGSDNEQAII